MRSFLTSSGRALLVLLCLYGFGCTLVLGIDRDYQPFPTEPCKPLSTVACYTGPEETLNVPPCVGGTKTCNLNGDGYGPCVNEVTPAPEDCSTKDIDEDCDQQLACSGEHVWSRAVGDAENQLSAGVATGPDNGVVVAGYFDGKMPFGSAGTLTGCGSGDIFVAKLDRNGEAQWTKSFSDVQCTGTFEEARAVAVDSTDGAVVLTGQFPTTIDFSGLGGDNVRSSAGLEDVFVAKFDAGGNYQWSQRFGGISRDTGTSVAVDGSGGIFVAGEFRNSIDFPKDPLVGAETDKVFLAKLDAKGVNQWSRDLGGVGEQRATGVTINSSGDVALVGHFKESIQPDGMLLTAVDPDDIYVVVFDAMGHLKWKKQFGGPKDQKASGAAFDKAGNLFVTGSFTGMFSFGGDTLGDGVATCNLFVAKLDPSLNHLWSKPYGSAVGSCESRGVAVDGDGNVVIVGNFTDTIDFGGGALTSADGSKDGFVAKFKGDDGAHLWSIRAGNNGNQEPVAVATDNLYKTIVTGSFSGQIDFDKEPSPPLQSIGSNDIFVVKLQR